MVMAMFRAGCDPDPVGAYGQQWAAAVERDLCGGPGPGHIGWEPDPPCGGWLHCDIHGCLTCQHQQTTPRSTGDTRSAVRH
jgi:hypothetical protein